MYSSSKMNIAQTIGNNAATDFFSFFFKIQKHKVYFMLIDLICSCNVREIKHGTEKSYRVP